MAITTLSQMVDPEVMADMIAAKIPKKIRVAPFANVDTTLQGQPGSTITVPSYAYIGDAEDVAEGAAVSVTQMTTATKTVTVKKAAKSVALTDEAILSGFGDPVGEANAQLSKAIAAKVDNNAMDALLTATLVYPSTDAAISYNGIVDALDLFAEEVNTGKVMFIHPNQVTKLRKDPNFLSADKYTSGVMMSGEIGTIANCRIVPTKKVPVEAVTVGEGESATTVDCFACPIVKLEEDAETEDGMAAMTIYLKRDVLVETDRDTTHFTTGITASQHYTVSLSNESKVVLAKFKK